MPSLPHDDARPGWLKARLAKLSRLITTRCREVARLTSEGRDRPLPLPTRLRIGLHRCFCTWCDRYAKQLDLLHEASQRFPEHLDETGGQSLAGDARERMKRALRQQANGES
jgi:hypothetical protein